MFTMQSGQIENALRGVGVPDISAKEMIQGVANCQAPLEHRGPLAMTKLPKDNRFLFPGMPPVAPTPNFYFPNTTYQPSATNIINIPPWQHVPWTPIPYPEFPSWQPIPYPDWRGGQYPWDDTTLVVYGPTYMGDVTSNTTNTSTVNSETITNEGDITNNNAFVNQGPVINNGPVVNNQNVVNNRFVTNKNTVVNEGDVDNRRITTNYIAHNYSTYNHGETYHFGPTYLEEVYASGPNEFAGDTYIEGGDVFVDGDTFDVDNTTINLGDDVDTTVVNVEGDTFNVNNKTVNLGDVTNTTTVNVAGDNIFFDGDIFFPDPGNPGGFLPPMDGLQVSLVTDVEWDGTNLIKKYRTISLLGHLAAEQDDTVVSGTSCPSTPISGSASNYVDMP